MRIIYIIRDTTVNIAKYPRYWIHSDTWYDIGLVLGYVLQFLAGFGIGWVVKSLLRPGGTGDGGCGSRKRLKISCGYGIMDMTDPDMDKAFRKAAGGGREQWTFTGIACLWKGISPISGTMSAN